MLSFREGWPGGGAAGEEGDTIPRGSDGRSAHVDGDVAMEGREMRRRSASPGRTAVVQPVSCLDQKAREKARDTKAGE